jgi:hypothetical protein
MCTLSMRVRNWCAPWAYASISLRACSACASVLLFLKCSKVYPQHARKLLMRALSMRVRNWCVHWACASGTIACTELTHQVLMRAQSAFPSKNAEHTHQELMRTLSVRVRKWCVCSACPSVPDTYAQHAHQFLTRMLSISIKIPNLKEFPTNHAEHTRKELVRMLSIRISSLRVCSACASETKCGKSERSNISHFGTFKKKNLPRAPCETWMIGEWSIFLSEYVLFTCQKGEIL